MVLSALRGRTLSRSERALVDQYLATHSVRSLQVGAGPHNLPGWLNSDIEPMRDQIYLDVTQPFPFRDETFRYVYAEQLIEHLPYEQAVFFLKESRRVLMSGGKIRLATPNLLRLLALFNVTKTPIQQKLIDYQIQFYHLSKTPLPETVTLNLFFRGGDISSYMTQPACAPRWSKQDSHRLPSGTWVSATMRICAELRCTGKSEARRSTNIPACISKRRGRENDVGSSM